MHWSDRIRSAWAGVSIPSATVSIPSERAMATIAAASADDRVAVSDSPSCVNSPAILRASTGNCRRWLSEK